MGRERKAKCHEIGTKAGKKRGRKTRLANNLEKLNDAKYRYYGSSLNQNALNEQRKCGHFAGLKPLKSSRTARGEKLFCKRIRTKS